MQKICSGNIKMNWLAFVMSLFSCTKVVEDTVKIVQSIENLAQSLDIIVAKFDKLEKILLQVTEVHSIATGPDEPDKITIVHAIPSPSHPQTGYYSS